MTTKSFKLFLVFSLTMIPFLASAQSWDAGGVIKYHGGTTPIRIGAGINKNRPLELKKNCLAEQGAFDPDTSATGGHGPGAGVNDGAQGAPETKFELKFIENTEELHDILSISGIVGANIKFLKGKIPGGKLEGSYNKETSVSKTSLNLVLKVRSNFGRQMLADPEFNLKEKYQALLDQGEFKKFEKYCGSHFVYMQRREGTVSAIFTIENLTEEEKLSIKAAIEVGIPPEGSWDDDTWEPTDDDKKNDDDDDDDEEKLFDKLKKRKGKTLSGSKKRRSNPPGGVKIGARLSLDNFLKSAKKIGKKATLTFHATGGKGLSGLSQLTSQFDGSGESLTGVLSGIGYYLEQYTFHSAPPVEYYLYPYFDFEAFEEEIDHALLEYVYYKFMDAESTMKSIIKKLKTLDPTGEEAKYLQSKFEEFDSIRDQLWDQGQMIMNNKNKSDNTPLTIMDVPQIPDINFNLFSPKVINAKYIFDCYSKWDASSCGTPSRSFPNLPTYYWEANLEISMTVDKLEKVKAATLYIKFSNEEAVKVGTVKKGYFIENDAGEMHFDEETGDISFLVGKMTQKKNRELYVKSIDSPPIVLVKIEKTTGGSVDQYFENYTLNGKHLKYKRNSKIDYRSIQYPKF